MSSIKFDSESLGAFGDLITAELTPVILLDFVHGINTQTGTSTVANGGSADTDGGRLRLQTSAATNGSSIFRSRRPGSYRPGSGMVARFTAVFTAGKASSTQLFGVGNETDGYFFGYNGASFGILYRNGGSDNWLSQTADWNGDKCDGTGDSGFTISPTNGNVFQVKYPFLGYGDISFWVQDKETARWIHCHTIKYTNTNTAIQLTNPRLFFYGQALNAGNNTNLAVYSGSCGLFVSGKQSFISSPRWAMDSNKSGITAETNVISLRNCTTYNGKTNRSLIRLTQLSFGSQAASGVCTIRFKLGATLGGAPAFATINGTTADNGVTITSGNSITSYDVLGTTVGSGTYIYNISSTNAGGAVTVDLTPYELFVPPGETLTISAFSTISSTFAVSVNWNEDV